MQVGEVVVLVEDVDGIEAGHEGRIMGLRDNMVMVGCRSSRPLAFGPGAHVGSSSGGALPTFVQEGRGPRMSEESVDVRPLTSVELLDAAVWREIGSEEAQPAAAFLDALSRLVGRWLLVRSDAPEMDAVTVLCKARGYIARQEAEWRG